MVKVKFRYDDSSKFFIDNTSDMLLCISAVQDLFELPEGIQEIVVVVGQEPRENAYKIMNDFHSESGEDYGDNDPDIQIVLSNGKTEFSSLESTTKRHFLGLGVKMPCYVSVSY